MTIALYCLAFLGLVSFLTVLAFMAAACYLSKDNGTAPERDSKEVVQ